MRKINFSQRNKNPVTLLFLSVNSLFVNMTLENPIPFYCEIKVIIIIIIIIIIICSIKIVNLWKTVLIIPVYRYSILV